MQRDLGVPAALITAINGLIVVFVVSSQIFTQRRQRRRASVAEVEAPAAHEAIPTRAEETV